MCKFYKNMNHFFHSFGIFLTVISILVLIGSFIYGFFYTLFFQDNDYMDFNSDLIYIAFWAILLATGESIVSKSSNSVFELENNKKGSGIANECIRRNNSDSQPIYIRTLCRSDFYTLFFQYNYYVDFNSDLIYIAFWAILLATGESIVSKSSNSVFELENNKKDSGEDESK